MCENVYSVYSCLASVWMPFVAHFTGYTLQIGDEDVEFSRKSASAFRFNRLVLSGRGTMATVETIVSVFNTSMARESRILLGKRLSYFI